MKEGERMGLRGGIARLARIGVLPTDDSEEVLRKETLVLASSLITALAVVWVVTYFTLGLYVSAGIPFVYQVVSLVSLAVFAKTKRYRVFRTCQLAISLVLPFLLQLSLGGFVASSGVVLWSFTAPLGALLFAGRRSAIRWGTAFVAVIAASAILDPVLPSKAGEIPQAIHIAFFAMNILGVTGTGYLLLLYFVGQRDRAARMAAAERERSERLLLNVLPRQIAERLKDGESVIADGAPDAGVLFADIAGFTPLSARMSPEGIVRLLNEVFTAFDRLVAEHGLEKIKTIGDAYMVASGLLEPDPGHAESLADLALAMRREAPRFGSVQLRIGMDIGPVVAGVIGRSRFIYDLWGDAVNTASRMESHGVPGAIQVTERAYRRLAPTYEFEPRGVVEVKGKGPMSVFLLLGPKGERTGVPPGTGVHGDRAARVDK
jgi:adenylate cyclase